MNTKPITQDEFYSKKTEALQNEPITKAVQLADIALPKNALNEGVAIIGGKAVSVSPEFFSNLGNILGISGTMKRNVLGASEDGTYFSKLIDALKVIGTGKASSVTLIANAAENQIIGVSDKPYSRIPNEQLFGIAERLVDQYPLLTPVDVDVTGGGFGTRIYLASSADVGFNGLGDDETFRFGFTLNNFGSGTSIGDFMLRLICKNGAMGISRMDNFTVNGLQPSEINKMFEHIAGAAKRRFVPEGLGKQIRKAIDTPSSLGEIERAFHAVTNRLRVSANLKDDTLKKHYQAEIARRYFPGYAETMMRLAGKGIDVLTLSEKQKKFINSGTPMWQVVNSLTFLGSNTSEFDLSDSRFLQKVGGKLLASEFDLEYVSLINA